ncbi:MAG: DUF2330 domain-containing protein [Myxococcales bacterium]|nr:DUF2330 domain-containing protein [Myxococcales bacterium]
MKTSIVSVLVGLALASPSAASAFCGFFVGKAGASLFNSASQVVIVHDDGKTVLTMVNDYQGSLEDFALVVPVPMVIKKEVVRVADMKAIDHLDAYSAPRLAEYHDPNPCEPMRKFEMSRAAGAMAEDNTPRPAPAPRAKVVVEASYTVGEYDIVILSSTASDALERWLRENGYNIPKGASRALRPYINTNMKFFVAKVNLQEMRDGFQKLRPLQFAFRDPRFMLPVRLGMINAQGPQDLIAYVISRNARVEPANYRNVMMPTGVTVPTFVRDAFPEVYRRVFEHQAEANRGRAVFTEYAWNMSWCDPCAADPLSVSELEELGVWWLGSTGGPSRSMASGAVEAFVTRLHARYDPQSFPEDLMMKVTRDTSNHQVRLVLQNPFLQPVSCPEAKPYFASVVRRRDDEVKALAKLTGWSPDRIQSRMVPLPEHFSEEEGGSGSYLDRVRDWFAE